MNTPKTLILRLTSAIALAGVVIRAGELVEVTVAEAKDLLRRGKAELANADADGAEVFASNTVEAPLHPAIEAFQQDNADRAAEAAAEAAQAAADAAAADTSADTSGTATDAATGAQEAASEAPKVDAPAADAGKPADAVKTDGKPATPQGRRQRQAANAAK